MVYCVTLALIYLSILCFRSKSRRRQDPIDSFTLVPSNAACHKPDHSATSDRECNYPALLKDIEGVDKHFCTLDSDYALGGDTMSGGGVTPDCCPGDGSGYRRSVSTLQGIKPRHMYECPQYPDQNTGGQPKCQMTGQPKGQMTDRPKNQPISPASYPGELPANHPSHKMCRGTPMYFDLETRIKNCPSGGDTPGSVTSSGSLSRPVLKTFKASVVSDRVVE